MQIMVTTYDPNKRMQIMVPRVLGRMVVPNGINIFTHIKTIYFHETTSILANLHKDLLDEMVS